MAKSSQSILKLRFHTLFFQLQPALILNRLAESVSSPEKPGVGVRFRPWPPCFQTLTTTQTSTFVPFCSKNKIGSPNFVSSFGTRRTVLRRLPTHRHKGNGCGMRAAIYVRCSTTNKKKFGDVSAYLQNPEAQVEPLVSLLASRG
jgi:hypothetical protein